MSGVGGRRPGRRRGIALLLAAVLVVAGSVAASQVTQSRELDPPEAVQAPLASSGTAYCPVAAGEGEGASLLLSALGDADAEVVITRYVDGAAVPGEPRTLPARTTVTLPVAPGDLAAPVAIDWRGSPVLAQYQLSDGTELLVADCASRGASRWHLAGFDTSLGNVSLLHLFNPYGQDALVDLQFGTPEGDVELVIGEELLVPARSSAVLNLAQFRPETPDLAVTVSSVAGRVVPQGQVDLAPPAEGVEAVTGRGLIPASPVVSETAFVPHAVSDAVTASHLTVYNPGTRAAAVQLQVTTPLAAATALASERTVPAGGTVGIDLAELSALPAFGVQLVSVNGVGIVATRTAAVSDVQRTGVAVSLAAPMTSEEWAVTGGLDANATLTLYNPGSTPAVAAVDVAGGTPETWTAVTVPPNGLTSLPLAHATPQGPALVDADGPLVVGVVHLRPESATAYWSATGTPQDDLVGGATVLPVQRDPGLSAVPAVSATVTPTPVAVDPAPDGEGGLGDAPDTSPTPPTDAPPTDPPPTDPGPTTNPTIEPPVVPSDTAPPPGPTEPAPAPGATPPPTGDPTTDPSPLPPGQTEEGSLFGKRRHHRHPRSPGTPRT